MSFDPSTIPILFSVGADPVNFGLVASLNRPVGNATGVYYLISAGGSKLLGIVHQLLPSAVRIGVLVNPDNPPEDIWTKDVTGAASDLGIQVQVVRARDGREIERGFLTLIQNAPTALLVAPNSVFFTRRIQLATLAARYTLPSFYSLREHVDAGGLLSYGTSLPEVYRQLGIYTGRILKGAKPADLPVVQSTKYELVLNLNTARALGVDVPAGVLALADEVIE
jgi:putative ABC transport system substrate-binding protein